AKRWPSWAIPSSSPGRKQSWRVSEATTENRLPADPQSSLAYFSGVHVARERGAGRAEHRGMHRRRGAEREERAQALVEPPVGDQAARRTGQLLTIGRGDLVRTAHDAPQPNVVEFAPERLTADRPVPPELDRQAIATAGRAEHTLGDLNAVQIDDQRPGL